ncbi:hypothetical protein DAPPUDRAFT_315758 [Daphnia pulex]|uniref:Uncharacterized protein n=1 Tax=Daphnia pulex TaxID=6669 RepID=E9GAR1_DAPPU|nr:hypothetical protein DAPPUDRAFT_315758 [Daphnia pulex]|eukprot:EFX83496.1 hypothetical protein DAPPUDRAFT_315758 [Daphnia pulex]
MNPPSDCYRRDYGEKESVDEIRHRINSLRQMVEEEVGEKQLEDLKKSSKKRTESMDTGSLLSFTFGFILFLLIAVGCYAFRSLYLAIMKRYGSTPITQ